MFFSEVTYVTLLLWTWYFSFITRSVLRQIHRLFRSEFFRDCHLVLPFWTSVFTFHKGYPGATYVLFLIFLSLLFLCISLNNVVQKAVHMQDWNKSVSLFILLYVGRSFPSRLLWYFIFHKIGPTEIFHHSKTPHFKTFKVFMICFPKFLRFSTINYASNVTFISAYLTKLDGKKIVYNKKVSVQKKAILTYVWTSSYN